MKIKAKIILGIITLTCFHSLGQDSQLFKLWPDSVLAAANSARTAHYLNEEEKSLIFYTNLVRINPDLFSTTYFEEYLEKNDIKKDKEIKKLIKDLEFYERMEILKPSQQLSEIATKHAKDMGNSGRTGHLSNNGDSFKKRMEEGLKIYSGINENCQYGYEKGIDILMDLLIDRDVPNYGHRKNILDPGMKYVGVAIEPHKRWNVNCVQDFGGEAIR